MHTPNRSKVTMLTMVLLSLETRHLQPGGRCSSGNKLLGNVQGPVVTLEQIPPPPSNAGAAVFNDDELCGILGYCMIHRIERPVHCTNSQVTSEEPTCSTTVLDALGLSRQTNCG
jgi:hypothetical protein